MTFKHDALWVGNPATYPTDTITIADIMSVDTGSAPGSANGSIGYTLGSAASGEVYTVSAMQFNSPGMMSIPMTPGEVNIITDNITGGNTSTTGAQALCYVRNDQWTVLGTRDTRTQDRPGNAGPGDTVMYAQQGQAAVLCKYDGTISLMTTTTGDSTGTNVIFTVGPKGMFFASPFGSLAFDETGFRMSTSSGASFAMTGTSDPTSGNQITISSGSTTISSGIITLGNPVNAVLPLPILYGVLPAPVPGIPILGEGVGAVTVNACASTTVFCGI
jgi:hypothetical protein